MHQNFYWDNDAMTRRTPSIGGLKWSPSALRTISTATFLPTPNKSFLVSPRLLLCLLCLDFIKVGSQVPSLLPVLLVGGPLVLGQDSFQHRAVQGSLDAESPPVKEVLGKPRKCLLHFGRLMHGIIVVKTKLVEPSSVEGPSLPSNTVK